MSDSQSIAYEGDPSAVVTVTFGFVSCAAIISIVCMFCCGRKQRRPRRNQRFPTAQPDEGNIFNISSRVQGTTNRDAYLSAEHITISNELNKPPKYDDAPPSYEEAIKLATAHSNSMQTFQAEQANRQNQPQTSTVTSTTTSAVLPAPIHRTE